MAALCRDCITSNFSIITFGTHKVVQVTWWLGLHLSMSLSSSRVARVSGSPVVTNDLMDTRPGHCHWTLDRQTGLANPLSSLRIELILTRREPQTVGENEFCWKAFNGSLSIFCAISTKTLSRDAADNVCKFKSRMKNERKTRAIKPIKLRSPKRTKSFDEQNI